MKHPKLFIFGSIFSLYVLWQALLITNFTSLSPLVFVLGFIFCFMLPGFLISVIFGLKQITLQSTLVSVGLSIIFLMIVGLLVNTLPYVFGDKDPLSAPAVLLTYNTGMLLLTIASLKKIQKYRLNTKTRIKPNLLFYISLFLMIVGLTVSVLGTFRLNNGGGNIVSLTGFFILLINVIINLLFRRHASTATYVLSIIGFTWGLMLVTSLRSWHISGQDLKQEFRVFNITNNAAHWSISNFKDSYNACLSITLLPYVVSKLLTISPELYFKLVSQLIFAVCPLAIFVNLSTRFKPYIAFICALLFLSLPTVGLDLPLQARQQIAFILFSLIIMVWFNPIDSWIKSKWQILFILLSFALVVSHYSTTYVYVGLLIASFIIKRILFLLFRKDESLKSQFKISGKIILLIGLFSFLWLSQTTAVASNLVTKFSNSIQAITEEPKRNTFSTGDPVTDFINENTKTEEEANRVNRNEIQIISDTSEPSQLFSALPHKIQIIIQGAVKVLYYNLGLLFYLALICIGIIYLLIKFRNKELPFNNNAELIVFSCIFLSILAIQIALPGISKEYGVTRTFIQAFIILVIPLAFCLSFITSKYKKIKSLALFNVITCVLLLTYSGVLGLIVGSMRPQLNFNNSGPYYGAFYVRSSDILSLKWTDNNIKYPGNVNSPDYSFQTAVAYFPDYDHYGGGIYPFQIQEGHYILINYFQNQEKISYIAGGLYAAKFDINTLDGKSIIYSNLNSQIYQ